MMNKIIVGVILFLIFFLLPNLTGCVNLFEKDLAGPQISTRNSTPGGKVHICFSHLLLQSFSKGIPFKTNIYKDGQLYKELFLSISTTDKKLDGHQHDYIVETFDLKGSRLLLSHPAVIFPTQSQGNVGVDWLDQKPVINDLYSYLKVVGLEKLKFVVLKNPFVGRGNIDTVTISVSGEPNRVVGLKISGKTENGENLEDLFFSSLVNPYVLVKYDATFNDNSFLWDDAFVSWFSLNMDSDLVTSTLDFWYSLQVPEGDNQGLIPREIRNINYIHLANKNILTNEINPLSLHPLVSDQVFGPYLLARVEIELYKKTKNLDRLKIVLPNQIAYFNWIEIHRKTTKFISRVNKTCPMYSWSNLGSGMDNSPRGGSLDFGWFDLAAQQVALARDIKEIASLIGQSDTVNQYTQIWQDLSVSVHSCYFSKTDSLWFDINPDGELDPNPTAASFWGIYAGLASSQDLHQVLDKWLANPKKFGGPVPLPSLPRDHSLYSEDGQYWRGGSWPPLWWIVIYGLKESGFVIEAKSISEQVLDVMQDVYKQTGSVFEFYAPDISEDGHPRAGLFGDGTARADFLGWGKLPLYLSELWK
jgi:hypothetical protein